MNLAIIGYGKMGRMIDSLAEEYDFTTVLKLDENNNCNGEMFNEANFKNIDVAIDFSTPSAVLANIEALCRLKKNVVVGTTGWHAYLDQVSKMAKEAEIGLIWSPNFSIGVNIFMRLAQEAAKCFQNEVEYEAFAYEIHHSAKLDSPSGTMLKIVEQMNSVGYEQKIDVASNRAGKFPGTHKIGFDSLADSIEITHTARSREGFARGALKAGQFIVGRVGVFEFSDIIFN